MPGTRQLLAWAKYGRLYRFASVSEVFARNASAWSDNERAFEPVTLAWISAETPDATGGGGQRRQFHQLKVLLRNGVDVRVVTLEGLQDDSSIQLLTPATRFRARRFRGHLPTHALGRIVDQIRPDGIVVAHVESVPLVMEAAVERRGVPVLVDFQNVYSRYYADLGDDVSAARWRQRERRALSIAAVATACSSEEAQALRATGAVAPIEVAPNAVDPDEWPDAALADERAPLVAFFGSLSHRPNEEGLRWFLDTVWTQITAAVPEARLLVIGPGEAHFEPAAGIEFCGRVDDLPRALGAVRVVAVPIVHGVGSRVKFGEALASGAAVVSTSVGCEGFDVRDEFVRADSSTAFATACIDLLRDPDRARTLGRDGRALALSLLTWSQATVPMLRFARSTCAPRGGKPYGR